GNPHSVAFQLQFLVRYLDNLARLLGGPRDEALPQALTRLQAFDLGSFEGQRFSECSACDPCLELAGLLSGSALAAATLSDRLAMRYFSHVGDVSRQTFAS
ncbi:MAG TPA: alpha-E domain-containing protein, partial [Pseudomonadales bacterium]|nr:alpha-E domain-containing protein [Pseudomonadales bacterium]